MLKDSALKWIDENENRVIEVSDTIWEYAEVGLKEYKSSKLIAEELKNAEFKIDLGLFGMPTAFTATLGKGKPVIAILGEYDALPVLSQKAVPWREPVKPEMPGHGCGHNIFGAAAMAGAISAKAALEKSGLTGTIRYYGCPAEETLDGKVYMVRDGLFKDADAVVDFHPGQHNTVNMGSSNAVNSVRFHFYGQSSHAAGSPEQGRSALDAVELMNVGVNYLREHVIPEARIHYVIEDGGRAGAECCSPLC